MTNKIIFTRWLRSKQLPLLLSFMLLAVAAMQSVHDRLDHDALGVVAHCEYCLLSQNAEGGLIPFAITFSNDLVENTSERFYPITLTLVSDYSQPTRAPPVTYSL